MRPYAGRTCVYLLSLGLVTTPTTAQLNTTPVFYTPTPVGMNVWSFSLDALAARLNGESGKNLAFGVRVSRGVSRITQVPQFNSNPLGAHCTRRRRGCRINDTR